MVLNTIANKLGQILLSDVKEIEYEEKIQQQRAFQLVRGIR